MLATNIHLQNEKHLITISKNRWMVEQNSKSFTELFFD
jgi:hypothetical protein